MGLPHSKTLARVSVRPSSARFWSAAALCRFTARGDARPTVKDLADEGAEVDAVAGGLLAKGFRPETIAVAVAAFAEEADVAGLGDFFLDAAEVVSELVVGDDAEAAFFEVGAQAERKFLFHRRGEGDGFDFPFEAFRGAFGELRAEAGGIDAGAFDLAQAKEAKEGGLDFRETAAAHFDAETVPNDVADFFADVEDAEVVFAGDVEAEVENGVGGGKRNRWRLVWFGWRWVEIGGGYMGYISCMVTWGGR